MVTSRESISGMWVALRVTAFLVALGGGWIVPHRARAEDELQKARGEAGRVWYDQYCRPCHGPGGAPGTAVYPDTKQSVDLRVYVQRHGGKFPAGDWLAVVFGPQPGRTHHTAIWQKVRSQHGMQGPSGEAVARGIVASIADYIIAVQTK
jgi:mono/diheme cytochrome c family protein